MPDRPSLEQSVEFAENPEPRCPCVLLLDTSGSMQGEAIAALNEGLRVFKNDLSKDPVASRRVEVAVVTFDSSVTVMQDFVTADQFQPPTLTAQGVTFMGEAIQKALDMVQARKEQYKTSGIAYYRPWVFMITDGEPQGEPEEIVQRAAQRIKDDENQKHVAFFAVGVENANMQRLSTIAVKEPLKLAGLDFSGLFMWLSASMHAVSKSKVSDQVALPPPGWANV
jgi:uncharacterized protein YegL